MQAPIKRLLLAALLASACADAADPAPIPEDEPSGSSELLYASATSAAVDADGDEGVNVDEIDPSPPAPIDFEAEAVPAWNSRAGRAAAEPNIEAEPLDGERSPLVLPQLVRSATACTPPQFMYGSENLKIPGGPRLMAPATAFTTEASARAYLSTVRAHMPMYLPFTHPDVVLRHGWIYNGGGSHRGQDYSRDDVVDGADPTFAVKAVAPGRVLVTYWGNAGNGVVIEHTAPDGFQFITVYYHLRNGHDNDLAKALAMDCSTSGDSRCPKYKLFAQNYPNHVSWGTNNHKLLVKAGDWVSGGQQIGWAGNTGPGGAGNGLNDDGSPQSPQGNVHLHTYWGAEHPSLADTYVHVDPYGIYDKVTSGCYDLLEDSEFARVLAPFYESFHNLPLEILTTYFNYYTAMGKSMRTLSAHRDGGDVRVSGAFESGIPGAWYTRIYMDEATYQSRFNEYYAKGLIPRETTVIPDWWGTSPRYTVTYRPLQAGESFDVRGRMTDASWSSKWTSLVVNAGWRVDDYFGYSIGGTDYQAATFTSSSPRPFYLWSNRSFDDLKGRISDGAAAGLAPVSVTASERDAGTYYNVILRRQPGCWFWYVGLSPSQYQSTYSNLSARGYRLHKIQGYDDSQKFAAVFTLASGAVPAVCP